MKKWRLPTASKCCDVSWLSLAVRGGHLTFRTVTRELGCLWIGVPVESEHTSKQPVKERDFQAISSIELQRVQGIVESLGIQRAQCRRFVAVDSDHPAIPARNLDFGRGNLCFDVRKQIVIFLLKGLVVASRPTKVENQLGSSYYRDSCCRPNRVEAKVGNQATACSGSQNHDREIEYPVPALERHSPACVVHRIPQSIEPNEFDRRHHPTLGGFGGVIGAGGVLGFTSFIRGTGCGCRTPGAATSFAIDLILPHFLVGGGGGGDGCLGPFEPCPPPRAGAGCLGPVPFLTSDISFLLCLILSPANTLYAFSGRNGSSPITTEVPGKIETCAVSA
ncbi:hypothetical protein SAMN02927914_00150 [Mesorhizobium qingshengii]|uniref:Uncharacterized protein n=1 Tax=Mesorhizobium qingshengii TaxID=1165689 RepID=A0A1G5V397_9HYPH|nr:hypothetical protein SAMN02927914_00150 [Mesorhizobium qingshengii]